MTIQTHIIPRAEREQYHKRSLLFAILLEGDENVHSVVTVKIGLLSFLTFIEADRLDRCSFGIRTMGYGTHDCDCSVRSSIGDATKSRGLFAAVVTCLILLRRKQVSSQLLYRDRSLTAACLALGMRGPALLYPSMHDVSNSSISALSYSTSADTLQGREMEADASVVMLTNSLAKYRSL